MQTVAADSKSDEYGWIRKAQTGDSAAFERLYRMHVDKVYGLCLRMTGNVAEAVEQTEQFSRRECIWHLAAPGGG
jgi:RNA polymerase sigma-70 factor (ECF subfamily)